MRDAQIRADQHGFPFSCEPGAGALLSSLAAAVPAEGRILELGTGAGVGLAWLPGLGRFHLVFVDAPGGKLEGLDRSIAALEPGGVLVVDDMDLAFHEDPELD